MARSLALLLLLITGCASSMGTIRQARPDTRFADDPARIEFSDGRGLWRVRLDGGERSLLFVAGYQIVDELPGDRFLLSDSQTDLFVSVAGERPREVVALRGRLETARFSRDGTTIVASRHADFHLPQREQTDDDALYVIDTATLAVRVIPADSAEWITSLGWSDDGKAVWTESLKGDRKWVDLASGRRWPRAEGDRPNYRPQRPSPMCPARREKLVSDPRGIWLEHEGSQSIQVVALDGYRRGWGLGDPLPPWEEVFFTPDCRYVVFRHDGVIWVAEIETRRVGPLARGFSPRLAP